MKTKQKKAYFLYPLGTAIALYRSPSQSLIRIFCSIPYIKNTLIIGHTYLVVKLFSENLLETKVSLLGFLLKYKCTPTEVTILHFLINHCPSGKEGLDRIPSENLDPGQMVRNYFMGKPGNC